MILNTDFWLLNTALAEPDEEGSASASLFLLALQLLT
jgi:hypothetical protein